MRKVVVYGTDGGTGWFSRTLQSADDWPKTRIARGDTAEEIARLKAEPGGEILAHDGTQFAHFLIRLGLVDQYRLWVLPAAAGKGAPLFPGLDHPLKLRLVKSTAAATTSHRRRTSATV